MKSKNLIIFFIIFTFSFLISNIASAQGINILSNIACIESGNCTPCDFLQIFVNGSNIIVGLTGVFGVLMFVYGGIVMITAYGNEARITWGKNILISTVVGIFIVLLAWSFIKIIIGAFFGSVNPVLPEWGPWNTPSESATCK